MTLSGHPLPVFEFQPSQIPCGWNWKKNPRLCGSGTCSRLSGKESQKTVCRLAKYVLNKKRLKYHECFCKCGLLNVAVCFWSVGVRYSGMPIHPIMGCLLLFILLHLCVFFFSGIHIPKSSQFNDLKWFQFLFFRLFKINSKSLVIVMFTPILNTNMGQHDRYFSPLPGKLGIYPRRRMHPYTSQKVFFWRSKWNQSCETSSEPFVVVKPYWAICPVQLLRRWATRRLLLSGRLPSQNLLSNSLRFPRCYHIYYCYYYTIPYLHISPWMNAHFPTILVVIKGFWPITICEIIRMEQLARCLARHSLRLAFCRRAMFGRAALSRGRGRLAQWCWGLHHRC